MILTRDNLLGRLDYHLERSNQIDVAVAWASDSDALSRLLAFGSGRGSLRTIVGISGNATHPNALRELSRCAQLRIPEGAGHLFHPKFYLFHQQRKRIGWIGSANLTRPGFQQNDELVFEFSDENEKASKWFNQLWDSLPEDCSTMLDDYVRDWQPPSLSQSTPKEYAVVVADVYDLVGELTDWSSFVAAIAQADQYWSAADGSRQPATGKSTVIGESSSWLNTITLGRAVVRREDWDELTREDCDLILGRRGYGLLGSMGGAGTASSVFTKTTPENLCIRNTIRAALQPVLEANDDYFANAACEFIAVTRKFHGFAGAMATRLLALARPDRAISVNGGSEANLSRLTKLPRSSLSKPPHGGARSYKDLLRWFEQKSWYSNPNPQDVYQHLLASARAGLFDAFVYEPRKRDAV